MVFAVIASIGGDERGRFEIRFECLDDRPQQGVFGAGAVGLRGDDDLMFGINGRDAGVALDNAFVGRHLGALVIGAIAFDDRPARPLAVMGMIG